MDFTGRRRLTGRPRQGTADMSTNEKNHRNFDCEDYLQWILDTRAYLQEILYNGTHHSSM